MKEWKTNKKLESDKKKCKMEQEKEYENNKIGKEKRWV